MAEVTIFHNPNCSTSRKALDAIRAAGHTPVVVEYLKAGWTKDQLRGLLREMGLEPADILRRKGDLPGELGLLEPGVGDDAILDAMVAHPVLVERPIVRSAKGTVMARPLERIDQVF